jgi:hypothetical protein
MPDSLSTTTPDADGNILSYRHCLTMKKMVQEQKVVCQKLNE